jgi:hypothetical protein
MNKKNKTSKAKMINHVTFVLDASSSMLHLKSQNVATFKDQLKHHSETAKKFNQESRASLYQFSDFTSCIYFDVDINSVPDFSGQYDPYGNTALIDATIKAIEDLHKIPTTYGDHAFYVVVQTDGEENRSSNSAATLSNLIKSLPENWTVAVMVPNERARTNAVKYGFDAGNIQIWETTEKGLEEVGVKLSSVTTDYYSSRSVGIKGTKTLFAPSIDFDKSDVKNNLDAVKSGDYLLLPVHKKAAIKPFVESWTKETYTPGASYFQLSKPEKLQAYKQVAIKDKTTGKVYAGVNARKLLKLPDYELTIDAASHPKFDIFIQSMSVNRNLVPGTQLLILK